MHHDNEDHCGNPHCRICGDNVRGFVDYLVEGLAILLFVVALVSMFSKSV